MIDAKAQTEGERRTQQQLSSYENAAGALQYVDAKLPSSPETFTQPRGLTQKQRLDIAAFIERDPIVRNLLTGSSQVVDLRQATQALLEEFDEILQARSVSLDDKQLSHARRLLCIDLINNVQGLETDGASMVAPTLATSWVSGLALVQLDTKSAAGASQVKSLSSLLDSGSTGSAVMVLRDGQVVDCRTYGLADFAGQRAFDADTHFNVASLAKAFTAAVIGKLCDREQLSFSDPVEKWIPELAGIAPDTTVEHLLRMNSGIPDYDESATDLSFTNQKLLEHVQEAAKISGPFRPRSEPAYSNTDYILLSIIAERVVGQPFREILRTEVFEPLGMNDSYVIDHVKRPGPRYALGCRTRNGELERVEPGTTTTGDGGVCVTLRDMAKWHQALLEGKVLSGASSEKLFSAADLPTKQPIPYGLGWFLGAACGSKIAFHTGSDDCACMNVLILDRHLSVAFLSNDLDRRNERRPVSRALVRAWLTDRCDPGRMDDF